MLVPWIMVQNRQSLCNSLLIFLNNGDVMMNDDEIVLVSYLGTLLGSSEVYLLSQVLVAIKLSEIESKNKIGLLCRSLCPK